MKAEKIINYLRAGFSLFWLKTHEPNRVREVLYGLLKGYRSKKIDDGYAVREWKCSDEKQVPTIPIEMLTNSELHTVCFAFNYHWFIDKPMVVQLIQDYTLMWQSQAKALIVVSPTDKIPFELQKDFIVLDMDLPTEGEIEKAIGKVAPTEKDIPKNKELTRLLNACKGLSRTELESVLALSFVSTEGERFSIKEINEHKAMSINKTGFLDVLQPDVSFDNIIGYDNIKRFILETINHPKAKGIMTIGPPGCGKTTLMKAIVGETGRFGLAVNMGKLFSKYQGETDQNVDTVIKIIAAIGPCIVLIDEFEKQFAGASGDGTLDSGTTRRATGRWLDFLQNRPEGVYIVGTANSFNGIPPEYLRPGRWDTSPFFIDLPNDETRLSILKYYMKKEGIKEKWKSAFVNRLEDFTGAEIEALVHIATMRNIRLSEAYKCIIPTAKVDSDKIGTLREWAKNRTIPAENEIPKGNSEQARHIDV